LPIYISDESSFSLWFWPLTYCRYGRETGVFHRADLLKVFYDTLPDGAKARILTNKKVTAIAVTDDSVSVNCADGTSFSGSIIVGADGVNSMVRDLSRDIALSHGLSETKVNPEAPFPATYRCMFGNSPRFENMVPGEIYESHGRHQSAQLFVGRERMWFFAYQKLPKPTSERKSYSEEETDEYAKEMSTVHLTKDLTIGDVYAKKNNAGLTNVGEGLLQHWSYKRVVVVGDAAHKVTPFFGLGFNSGIQDIVVLSNQLIELLRNSPSAPVDTLSLERAFSNYQMERSEHVTTATDMSARVMRAVTWYTPIHQLIDRYISPNFSKYDENIGRTILAPMVASSAVLDFLEEKGHAVGLVPWIHNSRHTTNVPLVVG
jgi:2-polyprenyl-6-methoxyphenol hydroxylase-like FAD-dependent oxidoreductase